jgi:hypothetical protein
MAPRRENGPLLVAGLAGMLVTLVVFGGGAAGAVILAVAMNGFSERAAAPVFLGWLLLVCGANVGLGTLAGGLVLRRRDPSAKRWGTAALFAIGWTVVPLVVGVAFLLPSWLR